MRDEIADMTARRPASPGGCSSRWKSATSGRLVGDVGLSPAEDEHGVIKVGYTMAPAHQGRGYATEAVRALVRYAFDVLDAEIVRAYASAENVPSIRVAEKAGLALVERFERTYEGETWQGVRFERRREGTAGPAG